MPIFNNPHPLLDNDNGNFNSHEFTCELTESKIKDGLYSFHFLADISEPNVLELIESELVFFAVKVDCKPYYSKIFKSTLKTNLEVNIDIDYEDIPADFSFDFAPLLITNSKQDYQNSNADYPMNNYTFNLSKNQIIGSHRILKLKFQRGYKLFNSGPLIKIVRLPDNRKPNCGTMDIKLSEQFNIIVQLNDSDYNKFLKINSLDSRLLDNLLSLPILQYVLFDLVQNEQNRDKEWAQMLDSEYNVLNLESPEDILKKCDEILQAPIPKFIDYFGNKYDN